MATVGDVGDGNDLPLHAQTSGAWNSPGHWGMQPSSRYQPDSAILVIARIAIGFYIGNHRPKRERGIGSSLAFRETVLLRRYQSKIEQKRIFDDRIRG